jgi:hypothetical protein
MNYPTMIEKVIAKTTAHNQQAWMNPFPEANAQYLDD